MIHGGIEALSLVRDLAGRAAHLLRRATGLLDAVGEHAEIARHRERRGARHGDAAGDFAGRNGLLLDRGGNRVCELLDGIHALGDVLDRTDDLTRRALDRGDLRHDAVGRIRYRGPGVATGYHLDPEASLERFRDGWFYPGDLAAIDADGYVCLRGRREDVIIRGGINLYPTEIEAVLSAHPAVLEAAVVPQASAALGEEVAAFVVPRGPVTAEILAAWCAERLAPYKRPAVITLLEELPRNSAGKVLKARLQA